MGIKYYYKSQVSGSIFEDITNQISVNVSGSNAINNVPNSFDFVLSPYKKDGRTTIYSGIDISIDDTILIVQDDTIALAYGTVYDNGRELIGWDHVNNRPYLQFSVKCQEKDFSSIIIDRFDYTSTSITSILDEIMLYVDDSLYHPTLGKYSLISDNINIAFSIEKKTARQAITELCEQIDCFWNLKTDILADTDEIYKVYTYLEISNISGVVPDDLSTWYEGIVNKHVRKGTIENPIVSNRTLYPVIAGESEFKLSADQTVIINHLDISCKIFENNTTTTYSRYTTPALPETFDYQLDAFADDIKYVSMLVKTTVLSDSTSTVVRVPSNFADNDIINIGDKAYFSDSLDALEETSFFTVNNVNVVNTTYTELTFDDLGFTPASGDSFEIISNIEIFRDETGLNYASQGVLIDCDKKSYAKLKFLDLSEPPSGQIISIIYTKVKDYSYSIKNDESIKNGLKYKEIKLDDSIVLTRNELANLASNLLVLKPKYDLNFISRRYGLAPVGLSISVKIDNFITEQFILNENNWQYLGANDKNNVPCFAQSLSFSTEISNPEKKLAKLEKQKKKISTNAENLTKNIQLENIKIAENITWSFNPLDAVEDPSWIPNIPNIISITDIDNDGFVINFEVQANVAFYRLDLSLNAIFFPNLAGYQGLNIGISGSFRIDGLSVIGSNVFYCQIRGVSNYNIQSYNSYTEIINLANTDYTYLGYTKGAYYNFNEGDNTTTADLINTNQVMTISGTPTITLDTILGYYYINLNANTKYASITSNSDLQSTTKYTFKILFNLNQVKGSGVQTLFRKNASVFPADALQEWDFTFINGVLYITMYENGGINVGYHQVYTTFTFTAGVDYSLIYSIDLTNNLFTLVINQTTVTFTVSTGGTTKTLAAMTTFNNSSSFIEIGRYSGNAAWNGDYILKRFEILPDIYINDATAKAESALFGL